MALLSAIEIETTRLGRDRNNWNSWEWSSVIGKRKLSPLTAMRARWLLRGGWNKYQSVRERIMSAVPATSDPLTGHSLTHRLAAHFPRLPVVDFMITAGGPELNQRWVWVIMWDMLARFNAWAKISGFQQEFLRAKKARENSITKIGDIELEYSGPHMIGWIYVHLKDKAGNEVSFAECPGRDHRFCKASYDGTLGGAIELLETFMKTWTPPLAEAA